MDLKFTVQLLILGYLPQSLGLLRVSLGIKWVEDSSLVSILLPKATADALYA